MRRLIAVALVVLGTLAFAASAIACSCAPSAPGESLRRSDAAIVGRLVEVSSHGQLHADYRYEVQGVYRGGRMIEPGQMLEVRSGRSGAACALPRRTGHRYGLFLVRGEGHWLGGICGVIEPRRLWAAAQHQPGANQRPPGHGISCSSA